MHRAGVRGGGGIMECQDISRFEEPRFYDNDMCGFEAGLLVEGMVGAGSPE